MIKRLSTLFIIMLISTISYQQNPLSVNFSSASVPTPGQPYDVDVRVSDFDNLLSFQIFILWDSTVLEIDTIPFVTSSLPDFDDSGITLPSETASMTKGNVRANWFSFTLSPETLPDDHLLFTMRFNPIGSDCDTTSIKIGNLGFSMNEAIDDNGEDIGVISNSLLVTIPGADCGGGGNDDGIGLIFSDQFVQPSTNVCIPMTTMNMDSISTFQGSAMWDPTVLSFTGVQEFGLPSMTEGSFNLNNTDSGVLTYVWFDLSGANPASIPDGGTIFEICFDVIGSLGESSIVKAFDGTPPQTTSIQISGENGVLPYYIEEGLITVSDGPPMFFTIQAESTLGCNGDEVCVDFTTENFDDIAAFQLTMRWNSQLLTYNRVENLNTTLGLFESFFNLATSDKLRLSWSDASTNGITLPDGTLLYTVCYDVNPDAMEGESTDIEFIDDSFPIEVIDGETNVVAYNMIDGSVTVGCAITVELVATQPSCFGNNNGAITANISGGTPPYSCEWFKAGVSVSSTSGHTSTCVLAGQSSASYMVIVTDSDGNSVTQSIELGPDEIEISGSTTPATCESNGTIDFMVSGGTGTLTTSFNPSVNPSSAPAGIYVITATDANGCSNTASFTVADECTNPIVIDATIINPTECNPCGMVTVVCSGGTGNFAVSYSPAIFDLNCVPAGSYMVTCTDDSGNTQSLAFVVMEEASMPINTSNIMITPADCNMSNGTVEYNLSGGCGSLDCQVRPAGSTSYVDCSTIAAYAAGDYELLVTDDDGNTATATFTVTTIAEEPLMVTVNSTTAATCESLGTVDISITGGCNPDCQIRSSSTPPVIYDCDDNLPPGSYTVRVTDDIGTIRNALFTIADESGSATLTASVTDIENAPCASGIGSATLNYSGGCEPVVCTITRNGVLLTSTCENVSFIPGNYVVTYTGNMGATASQSFTIGSDGPAITIAVDSNMDGNVSVTASGGTPPFTYLWMFPNGTTSNSEDLSGLTVSGDYTLQVTDSNGCTATTTVTVDTGGLFASSIAVTSDFEGFGTPCAVNSNPCEGDGVIDGMISGGAAPYTITITNQSLEEFTYSSFPLTGVCAGNYNLVITDATGLEYEHPSAVNVTAPDPIVISLDGQISCEDEGMSNGAIETMVSGGVGGYTYSWTPSGSNGPDNLNIAAGMYILTVEDANLCSAQMLFEVRDCNFSGECYEAISVISPNNDGINDQFIISCAGSTSNALAIYNRFGKTVYETNNYNNDWSGIDLDGADLVEGAYFWVLQLSFNNGDTRIVKGTVTLLRN